MDYRVLGKVEVVRDGAPVDLGAFRQRSLLALLLMNANSIVSTDRILDELWDEDTASDRQNTLWVYVSNLRKALDPDREKRTDGTVLLTRAPGYVLQIDPAHSDAARFEQLVEEGRALLPTDAAAASIVLGEALGMWQGRAYEDYTYEPFAHDEIARLESLRLEAVSARIDADLARGLARELVSELESLVRQHPLREEFTSQLMLALYRSGRQAEALRAYQMLSTRLGEELGIEPSGPVRKLEEQIVTGDAALDIEPAGEAASQTGLAVRGYELREEIGAGAFGVAYRAYQPAVGREVAIKVIRPELANSPTFIRRFEAEAQLVARLEHPHIVPLYDYWREPDAAYLVMRLVRGGSLADVIRDSGLSDEQALQVAEHVGTALRAAHQHGVVHRDIKPENILIDEEGNAYLSDFGIAVADGDDTDVIDDYMRAVTLGPPYASPEHLAGEAVTASSDIFSLGVVLAQGLTGLTGEIAQIKGALDTRVAGVIERATAPNRADRYDDVAAFVADLAAVLDDAQLGSVLGDADARNPFKGLASFETADAGDFYGREPLVERLLDRFGKLGARSRFVALVGASGSGKSSVVKAGLLPALQSGRLPLSENWFTVAMTPAPHPFEELEAALLNIAVDPPATLLEQLTGGEDGLRRAVRRVLPEEGSQLLIVIDQFEELFTQVDEATADAFLDVLAGAVTDERSRVRVLVTLRADFYDRPLRHRRFGELLRNGTEVITPMSAEELERAIVGPAESVGISFDPALIATLIGDVADRAGTLPLLQYALTELFVGRSSNVIGLEAYQELGGVSGALAERADSMLVSLSPVAQECAREVFLRLVTLGEGTEDTRRRVRIKDLEQLPVAAGDLKAVLDAFGGPRLLSFDRDPVTRGPTVEIAHEALLTQWQTLSSWIDEARSDLRQQRRLQAATREWTLASRDAGFLLSAGRLARYEDWLPIASISIGEREREYLEASRARRDAEVAEVEARRRREFELEEKARRRLSIISVVLAVGLIVSGVLGVVAITQAGNAEDERMAAELAADQAAIERDIAEEQRAEADRQTAEAERQRRAVEAATRLRIAEGLPSAALDLRAADSILAVLLAGESIWLASETGIPADDGLGALSVALLHAGASFPDVREVNTVTAPEGSRGVFAVSLGTLLDLHEQTTDRSLTEEECLTHLGQPCPAGALRDRLPDGFAAAESIEPSRQFPLLANTQVILGYTGLDEQELAIWQTETRAVTTGLGVDVVPSCLSDVLDVDLSCPGLLPGLGGRQSLTLGLAAAPSPAKRFVLDEIGPVVDVAPLVEDDGNVPPFMRELLTDGDARIGVWVRYDVLSAVWYRRDVFDALGLAEPTTWAELVAVSQLLADAGQTPWCVGLRGDAVVPVMAMVQSQVAALGGLELHDAWLSGEADASDSRVVRAHRQVADLLFNDDFNGGRDAARVRNARSTDPLLVEEPRCVMWTAPAAWAHRANLASSQPVDLGVFVLPSGTEGSVAVSGTFVSVVRDMPESRIVLRSLLGPNFGDAIARSGVTTDIPANMRLSSAAFKHDESRVLAQALAAAGRSDAIRLNVLEAMPGDVIFAYASSLERWFDDPEAIEEILAEIDEIWQASL